jgi:hypothetical protein
MKCCKKPRNQTDPLVQPKQWKRDIRFGTSKELDLEVNAEKTKYMVMSSCLGQNGKIQRDNKSFATMEQFKYLGTTLTYQNFIHQEIKSRLKSGYACYHSVQNLLSSSLLSRSVMIKICRTIILLAVLYGCES